MCLVFDWQGTLEILAQASLLPSPASSLLAAQRRGMSCRGTLQGTSLEFPRLPCSPVPGPGTAGKAGCGAPCGVTMWCGWHVLETKGAGTRAAAMRHGRSPNMRSMCHVLTGSRGLAVPWGPSLPGRGSCWRWPPAHLLLGVGVSDPECVPKSAVLASEQPPRWPEPYQRLAMAPMGLDSRGSHPGAMASQGGGRRGRGGVRSLEHSQAALDWA